MNATLQASIDRQRSILKGWRSSSLALLADDCRLAWPDRRTLERRLMEGLAELPYCKYLYLLDERALQITSNASRSGLFYQERVTSPLDERIDMETRICLLKGA